MFLSREVAAVEAEPEEQIGPRVGLLVQRLPCLIQCETGEEKSKNPRPCTTATVGGQGCRWPTLGIQGVKKKKRRTLRSAPLDSWWEKPASGSTVDLDPSGEPGGISRELIV